MPVKVSLLYKRLLAKGGARAKKPKVFNFKVIYVVYYYYP
jgi:hypothetical protein